MNIVLQAYLRKMRIIDGYYYFEIQPLMNRNTVVLNASVIFFRENKYAKEFCLIILTVLSILNGEIIKHDPCMLHENENMSAYFRVSHRCSYYPIIKKLSVA